MTDPGFSQALAKVVDRLMDRFLPEPVSPHDRGEEIALWLGAFIGAIVWGGGLVVYLSSIDEFISPKNFLTLLFVLLPIYLLLTWLIARSFDRGRPLTYFFRGLIVPALSFRILRLAFPL